jgi:hypothetical protein
MPFVEEAMQRVKEAGGQRIKSQRDDDGMTTVWFSDPVTNSTLMMHVWQIHSVGAVKRHMSESRTAFGIEEEAKP